MILQPVRGALASLPEWIVDNSAAIAAVRQPLQCSATGQPWEKPQSARVLSSALLILGMKKVLQTFFPSNKVQY